MNVIRSSNSAIDRIALEDGREEERFPVFLLPLAAGPPGHPYDGADPIAGIEA
jgi:hypothetical protein